ncbi:MAG: GrpB family protein [Candidatus Pacebacteria bacterium]|nr:GrpB family protein [Candidatus Paceibacterota bacterium]
MDYIKIYSYHQNFTKAFKEKKQKIVAIAKDIEVHHIGSTAVCGLGGKGIIDIMVGVKNWQGVEKLITGLRQIGFGHIHPREKGKIFLSNVKESRWGDFHIHLVVIGSAAYRDLLAFRDYLRKHPKEVERYFELKLFWYKRAKGERAVYTKMKHSYIKEILKKANSDDRCMPNTIKQRNKKHS